MTQRLLVAIALVAVAQPVSSAPERKRDGGVVRVAHHDPSGLPSRGPTTALVTIELFFTPGQSSRVQAYRLLEKLQASHPSRIRLVYRIVKGSAQLPYAALEAHASGKFFELMDLINAGRANPTLTQILEVGAKVGLNTDRLEKVIRKPPAAYDRVLEANERRRKQRIRGNPPSPNALFNGRSPSTQLSTLGMTDLEREYQAAKKFAEDLLDRGADRGSLAAAFDQVTTDLTNPAEIVVTTGDTDEELDDAPSEPALATPPLKLTGLPSYGPVEATTTIAVLCSPTSSNCIQPLRAARIIQELFPQSVRVVWGPYFDVGREDAADLSLLADAALCAEKLGITLEERSEDFGSAASPGWRWVDAVLSEANNRHRRVSPDKVIDKITDKLQVNRQAFATCRAQIAGATIAWIEDARRAGVRTTPSTVVGGRIYGPITDQNTLQLLIEAELAPGWLAPAWMWMSGE